MSVDDDSDHVVAIQKASHARKRPRWLDEDDDVDNNNNDNEDLHDAESRASSINSGNNSSDTDRTQQQCQHTHTTNAFMSLVHQYTPPITLSAPADLTNTTDADVDDQDPVAVKRRKMAERQRRFRQNNPTVKIDVVTMQDVRRLAEFQKVTIRDAVKV